MDYLTPKELKRMMLFSWERVERDKEEINKINVFPVPDQDTGTNLAKTLLGIKEEIKNKEFDNLSKISESALNGAMTAAQGNAGIIYTGFLAGFLPSLEDKSQVDSQGLARAFRQGLERAVSSIQDPKEGTILDVIRAAAETFEKEAPKEKNIVIILQKATGKAQQALLETQAKMEILKKANVVDAGGLGFLMILESYVDALDGEEEKEMKVVLLREEKPSEKVRRFIQTISNRYEVVALIEEPEMEEITLKQKLGQFGNSLDIVSVGNKVKIHIHTDFVDEVKDIIRNSGKVQNIRIEDMAREAAGEESLRNVSIGIIVDQEADLTPKIIERYEIKTLPYSFNNQEFVSVCEKQLEKFRSLLVIVTSSGINSNYQQAMKARLGLPDPRKIYVLNSNNVSAGQALLILKAIELIREQREMREIIKILNKKSIELQTYTFLPVSKETIQNKETLLSIPLSTIKWIARWQKVGANPLIGIRRGRWVRMSPFFRAKDASEAIFKKIKDQSKKARKNGQKIRVVIAHQDGLEQAKVLKNRLKEIEAEVSFTNSITSASERGLLPGSLMAAWDIIE